MKLRWGDFIIAFIIVILVTTMFISGARNESDKTHIAEISKNGTLLYKINLDLVIDKKEYYLDDNHIKIVTENGMIRFEESDCPDLVCVHTGWISKTGQISACLPNGVLIKIVGEDDEVDVVLH